MGKKITMEDLQKAIHQVTEELPTEPLITEWGWIESDAAGKPITIGLNENYALSIKELFEIKETDDLESMTLFGMDIYVDPHLPSSICVIQ